MKMRIFCASNNEIAFEFGFKLGFLISLCISAYLWQTLGLGGPEDWSLLIRYFIQASIFLAGIFIIGLIAGVISVAVNEFIITVFYIPRLIKKDDTQ